MVGAERTYYTNIGATLNEIVTEWSEEKQYYVVDVQGLPGFAQKSLITFGTKEEDGQALMEVEMNMELKPFFQWIGLGLLAPILMEKRLNGFVDGIVTGLTSTSK